MLYRNTHPTSALVFELDKHYTVPCGATVELDAALIPWVLRRGLNHWLKEVEAPVEEPAPAPVEAPKPAKKK